MMSEVINNLYFYFYFYFYNVTSLVTITGRGRGPKCTVELQVSSKHGRQKIN